MTKDETGAGASDRFTDKQITEAFAGAWGRQANQEAKPSKREEVLQAAKAAVMKGRNNTYGPPTQDFARSAEMMTSAGFVFVNADGDVLDIQPHHVAMLMIIVKLSRATWSPEHGDHWVDIAGYAACGWECV